MANAKDRPRARFAPIPIETTFERYRKSTPAGELTPSPSPRSPSPPPREKRRFAPQLVESSVRRSRRAGDEGPATKHTDKTDITPYTNHIYARRSRKRLGHGDASPMPTGNHGRRESCDDEIALGVFDLVARDAQSKLQEVAMSAFPNSGQRIGGAEHFYVREGSDDDQPRGRPLTRGPWRHLPSRRNSSEEDISWAFKEMQEHVRMVSRARSAGDRLDTMELDNMSIDSPPSDAMGLTRTQRTSIAGSPLWASRRSSGSLGPIGEHHMPLLRAESPLPTIGESTMPFIPPESPPLRPIGESYMPYIPSAPAGKAADMPYAPASQIPPETGFRHHSPFMPYGQERDMSLDRARHQHRLRLKGSPPMLGQDLTFRLCPSPKQTKLEPDHLWDVVKGTTIDDHNRDPTEQHGLWRGYCYTADESEKLAPAERPVMITTPLVPSTPHDPFAHAFGKGASTLPITISEEPTPMSGATTAVATTNATTRDGTLSVPPNNGHLIHTNDHNSMHLLPEHRTRSQQPKGLHMLHNLQNLDEKLRREKAAADLEDKIAAEFDDHFVTQVYNYLSLGYPATARQYDEELSKISRIGVSELERNDEAILEGLWGGGDDHGELQGGKGGDGGVVLVGGGGLDGAMELEKKKVKATGHILQLDGEAQEALSEEDRCSRWRALKLYIYEWARQHPDLNAISPLAWGVQERRGSWGI